MSKPIYRPSFYATRQQDTRHAAERVLSLVLRVRPFNSVLDVGCGVGTWLSVAREMGVETVRGIEGPWVQDLQIDIPRHALVVQDLSNPLQVDGRFDLVISLEVAEHLPGTRADSFVDELCGAAPMVLFSAALPGQGGTGHINEQWHRYWKEKFGANGYHLIDAIRPEIWEDDTIPYWYRQNSFLYVDELIWGEISHAVAETPGFPLHAVHPDLYDLHRRPGLRNLASHLSSFARRVLGGQGKSGSSRN